MHLDKLIGDLDTKKVKEIFHSYFSEDGSKQTSCYTIKYRDGRETVLCKTGTDVQISIFNALCQTTSTLVHTNSICETIDRMK